MISMKASKIAEVIGGTLKGSDVDVTAPAFLSSADCVPGSLFLAIKGEKVDGHNFIGDAFAHGAVLALTTADVAENAVVVDDVTQAIGKLAGYVRDQLTELSVIGITGSQGKTTTKELLLAILSAEGNTIATKGNNNNELGVPLTLLRCATDTRYCIVEIGARHLGDIAALAKIAKPDIGVVLRVAEAHLGEFGSIEKIAETKSEMISSLSRDGIAILGEYDPFTTAMRKLHQGEVLTFGETSTASIRATDIELREGRAYFDLVTPEGRSTVALRLYGLHQISNALAAAAVAHALGISTDHIAGQLSIAEMGAKWRMDVRDLNDLILINDAYNASPDSMAAALTTLAHLSQERGGESWAFLGNMRELGESGAQAHAEIGRLASDLGIDHLVTVGASDYRDGVGASTVLHQCADRSEALAVAEHINRGDVVLCKASRSDRLELLADEIEVMWSKKISSESEEGVK
ncbi:MurF UDP-N-acetylmuramyl pentapeptide synthase [Candidatus Nanopelagicaceae bacterium]